MPQFDIILSFGDEDERQYLVTAPTRLYAEEAVRQIGVNLIDTRLSTEPLMDEIDYDDVFDYQDLT